MDEMRFAQSVTINQPVKEIFAYLNNFENLVEWASVVIAVRKLSPEMLVVGSTMKATIRFLGHWLEMTFEIIECEPDSYLTIKSIAGACPSLFCYRFEPSECGGTILYQEAFFQPVQGIIGLADPVVASALRRQLEYDLLTLKDILETRAPVYETLR